MDAVEVVLASIALIVVLLAARVPLYAALPLTFIFTALLYGGPQLLVATLRNTLLETDTWGLVLSVIAVSWLVSLYGAVGTVERLSSELSKAFRNVTLAITVIPGVIGLLPVPGGALMSAPIVDSLGSMLRLTRDKKLFVNVWYRHVIVYVYPLNSVIILASAVTGVSLWELVTRQAPVALAMFALGLPIVFGHASSHIVGAPDYNIIARGFLPILLALMLAPIMSPIDTIIGLKGIHIAMSVLVAVSAFKLLHGASLNTLLKALGERRVWELAITSFFVMALRELFLSMDLESAAKTLLNLGASGPLLAVLLPIVFSTISGHPTAGLAIATPLIASVTPIDVSTASLIYASAFIGYIASPLHLCYIYTAQYYRVPLVEGYKYMLPATIASLLIAFTLFIIH